MQGVIIRTLQENIKSIGAEAFKFCSALTSLTIPDNLTTINAVAFANCYSMKALTIGKSLYLLVAMPLLIDELETIKRHHLYVGLRIQLLEIHIVVLQKV